MIDNETLRGLLRQDGPALSMYFPLSPQQRDERGPQARLRALCERAGTALEGLPQAARDAMVAPARDAAEREDFAHRHDHGFVLFSASGGSQMHPLPEPAEEALVVGPCVHIKPLLPALARNRRFHLLALGADRVRLFSATPYDWQETRLSELPPQLEAEALEQESAEASPGRNGTALTTAADPAALRQQLLAGNMAAIEHAVRHALAGDNAPLLLAGEPQIASRFRAASRLPQLQGAELALNPFALPVTELHARAAALMAPAQDEAAEAVLEQVRARLGTAEPDVGIRPEEIFAAARDGRIDAIVVALDHALWGRFDPPSLIVHGHQAGAEPDLLNEAAVAALCHGGRAYAVPRERLPRQAPCVATYRF